MDADAGEDEQEQVEGRFVAGAARAAEPQHRDGKSGDAHRQQDEQEDDDEAAEELAARSPIVQRLAVDAHRRPDALAHLGLAPEMVDAEREDAQDAVEEAEAEKAARRM